MMFRAIEVPLVEVIEGRGIDHAFVLYICT